MYQNVTLFLVANSKNLQTDVFVNLYTTERYVNFLSSLKPVHSVVYGTEGYWFESSGVYFL